MRTTVTLDDDVVAAIAQLRRQRGLGLSEALNDLARAGSSRGVDRPPFRQRTADLGAGIDVRDVAEALDIAEGSGRR